MIVTNHLEYNHFTEHWSEDIDGGAGLPQALVMLPDADFQLVHLETLFITDANAANRVVTLKVSQDGILITLAASEVNQVASKSLLYVFAIGQARYQDPNVDYLFFPLPDRMRLRDTAQLTLHATNIQVGDQFTNTRMCRNLWQSV